MKKKNPAEHLLDGIAGSTVPVFGANELAEQILRQ